MKTLSEYVTKYFGIFNPNESHGFILIKPGEESHSQEIIEMFEEQGWSVCKLRTKTLLKSEAERLYEPHKKEEWFPALVEYMISGPCTGAIIRHEGQASEQDFKDIAKIKDVVREKFGESDMRNVLHSSDSEERFKIEAGVFFWL